MSEHISSNPCNYRDLVSDLVACALIEGNRHTQAAEFETKKAKQKVLDLFEAMESVGIRQERALARPAPETNVRSVESLVTWPTDHDAKNHVPVTPVLGTPHQISDKSLAWLIRYERGSNAHSALVELWERRPALKANEL